jgi:hypothetical protein
MEKIMEHMEKAIYDLLGTIPHNWDKFGIA